MNRLYQLLLASTLMLFMLSCSSDPVACFDHNREGMSIRFDASCSENVTHYNWDFDFDNQTSKQKTPSFEFPAGYYVVTLRVENSSGDSDEMQAAIDMPRLDCSFCRCDGGDDEWKCHEVQSDGRSGHYDWRWEFRDNCETHACAPLIRNY